MITGKSSPGYVGIVELTRVLAFSTSTPLAANGVYTSPTIDALNYKIIGVKAFSDVAGSYTFQQSDDGLIWDISATTNITANTPSFLNLTPASRYVRAIYTNGTTIQTTFRISGTLSPL